VSFARRATAAYAAGRALNAEGVGDTTRSWPQNIEGDLAEIPERPSLEHHGQQRVDLGGSTHDAEGIRDPKARTYAQKLDRLREDASRWEVNYLATWINSAADAPTYDLPAA